MISLRPQVPPFGTLLQPRAKRGTSKQRLSFIFEPMNTKTLILFLIMLLLASACAKKAPPVPWESIVPKRIVDLRATPREGRLLLDWGVPKENTDKSVLDDLAGFQILRSEGVLVGEECKGCGEKKTVVHEMKWDSKEEEKKKRVVIFFEDQEARKVYVYQVVSTNRRGYPSAPSNPVTVYWDHPPQVPRMVRGEEGDKKVELYWEPVEGATGYNVYRRLEEREFSNRSLNREPLTTTHFSDLNVENEKKYIYSVRAVRKVAKTDVEGKGSLGVPMTPTDLIAPVAPIGLVAIPLKDGMELNWSRNRETDLLGYYVYRRETGEKEFKRLTETPLTKETYLDTEVALQQEYEYVVTAVDNSIKRNESPRSEEVRVTYLY
jgi:fibronectin type 3 domain-containing protein